MTTRRQVCILPDTNIWLSDHMLRVRTGASLLHTVDRLDAVIGFPEVVDLELKAQWERVSRATLQKARDIEQTLRGMSESVPLIRLPTEESLTKAYDTRIVELGKLLVRVPLTPEHVRGALQRVIAHLPPSGPNNEQFRDTTIWEAALQLAATFDVHFITGDKGFADAVAAAIRPRLEERVAKAQFALRDIESFSVKAFETGKPGLALSYTLTFRAESTRQSDSNRLNAKVTAVGACVFDLKNKTVSNIRPDSEEITWVDTDGREHRAVPRDLIKLDWAALQASLDKVRVRDIEWTAFDSLLNADPRGLWDES